MSGLIGVMHGVMEDGRCRMQGSFMIALWFNEAMKLVRG